MYTPNGFNVNISISFVFSLEIHLSPPENNLDINLTTNTIAIIIINTDIFCSGIASLLKCINLKVSVNPDLE